MLRHRNLASYILSTVEFAGAGDDEASIVSVPPYHIAGISARSCRSTYSGRRVVHLEAFDPEAWVRDGPARKASPTPWSCPPCSAASST